MKALLTGDDSKVVDVEYFVSTFPLAKSNIYYYRGILSLKKYLVMLPCIMLMLYMFLYLYSIKSIDINTQRECAIQR